MNLIFRRRILAVLGLCVILVPFAAIPAQAQTASAPAIPRRF
jgi:hypothetical protein